MTRVWHVFFFRASIGSIVVYAYLETASMNIRVYFYPSKPYKGIAIKLQRDPKKLILCRKTILIFETLY